MRTESTTVKVPHEDLSIESPSIATHLGDRRPMSSLDPSIAMRWFLAALSFAAGAIHLVMVPQHAQESLRVGLAFAAVGWFQIGFGAAMAARPSRRLVQLAIAANTVFVAVWALSRTAGLPPWTGAGGVEAASAVDILCVVFEVGILVSAVALLAAPNMLRRWSQPALVAATIVPIGILAATTAVIASPSTANHVHAGAEDHSHLEVGAVNEAATAPGDHHHGESDITYDQLPQATKAEVDQVAAIWARKYPTGADAAKAGWFKATPSLYGIGAHYIKNIHGFSVAEPFDLLNPNVLLYDGEGPDAKFAGVSYIAADNPEGFTGPYDVWHSHSSVCIKGAAISLTEEDSPVWLSDSECTARGGRVMPLAADKMIHVWIGPGYNDVPILAHDNPKLYNGFNPKRDM